MKTLVIEREFEEDFPKLYLDPDGQSRYIFEVDGEINNEEVTVKIFLSDCDLDDLENTLTERAIKEGRMVLPPEEPEAEDIAATPE